LLYKSLIYAPQTQSYLNYEIDEKDKNILLTNDGINNVEEIFSNVGILKNNNF